WRCSPMMSACRHSGWSPARQWRQCPQKALEYSTAFWPTVSPEPAGASATTPAAFTPCTRGSSCAMPAPCSRMYRSQRFKPTACTRSSASPGFGTGFGKSRSFRPSRPRDSRTAALMVVGSVGSEDAAAAHRDDLPGDVLRQVGDQKLEDAGAVLDAAEAAQ